MKKVLFAGLLTLTAGMASAQVAVEAAFGSTNLDASCAGTTYCKNNGTGGKLLVSYAVNPTIDVEVGYVNFGQAKAGVEDDGGIDAKLKSTAFYIGGAARGEFGKGFFGVARLGLAQVSTKTSVDTIYGSGSVSETGTEALFGFGVGYAVTPQARVTAAVDFTQSPIADGEETATLRLISVGLRYSF